MEASCISDDACYSCINMLCPLMEQLKAHIVEGTIEHHHEVDVRRLLRLVHIVEDCTKRNNFPLHLRLVLLLPNLYAICLDQNLIHLSAYTAECTKVLGSVLLYYISSDQFQLRTAIMKNIFVLCERLCMMKYNLVPIIAAGIKVYNADPGLSDCRLHGTHEIHSATHDIVMPQMVQLAKLLPKDTTMLYIVPFVQKFLVQSIDAIQDEPHGLQGYHPGLLEIPTWNGPNIPHSHLIVHILQHIDCIGFSIGKSSFIKVFKSDFAVLIRDFDWRIRESIATNLGPLLTWLGLNDFNIYFDSIATRCLTDSVVAVHQAATPYLYWYEPFFLSIAFQFFCTV